VPAVFVELAALPLNPSGKVDRRALPAPENTRPSVGPAYVAPSMAVEQQLAAIWAEVLRVERVGVHDNFFELGRDSILSLRVLAQAREQGLNFSLQQLFQHPNIQALAQVLETSETQADVVETFEPFSLLSEEDRARLQQLGQPGVKPDEGKV